MKKYWLLKTEPSTYSIDDLKREKVGVWDGIRNFQARNNLKEMNPGDLVIIYHSSTDLIGVYGVGEVVGGPFPDPSQFDNKSQYFDRRASREKPIWVSRKVKFIKKLERPVTLTQIRKTRQLLPMKLLERGSRLSVVPVEAAHFETILRLGSQGK